MAYRARPHVHLEECSGIRAWASIADLYHKLKRYGRTYLRRSAIIEQ